jgi:mono/diheme cytochrome c family protein
MSRVAPYRSFILIAVLGIARAAEAANPAPTAAELQQQFAGTVAPFLATYCVACHGEQKPKGGLNLSRYDGLEAVVLDHPHWAQVLDQLVGDEMPPAKARRRPTPEERQAIVAWIESMRRYEGQKNAGDPGVVLARRLSNAEYDNTIRDLTGVDIRPTREFPVDPANESGFDNSGESLGMSPALLKKYFQAARQVADLVALVPDGLTFAPHPVVADTDRDRFNVNRIIGFYQRQETDYARYFEAAWRWKHRAALGLRQPTLKSLAAEAALSPKYLATVFATLEAREAVGPLARLQEMWRQLPRPSAGDPQVARTGCEAMRDFVVQLRKKLVPEVKNLSGGKVNNGSQPLLMWKNRQWAANRRRCDPSALQIDGVPTPEPEPVASLTQSKGERAVDEPKAGEKPGSQMGAARKLGPDPELFVPGEPRQRARYQASFDKFCAVFPDAFYVSERGRTYADQEREKEKGRGGRLLNAGFHSMTGYFRDDGPLQDLLLDQAQQRELDRLWDDFFFMSAVAVRMHTSFLWFERSDSSFMMSPEFNFTRAEDKSCTDEPVLERLSRAFEQKARDNGASETVLQAIRDHFAGVNKDVRWLEKTRTLAIPRQLEALQGFAERAYRRPLEPSERDGLVSFYRGLRDKNGIDHEEAIRSTIVSVLMSPKFLYRVDAVQAGEGARPLSDLALASRLSYFLWASMPDRELLDLAARDRLHRPEVLVAQARRMSKDPRARGLVTEFVGNWLDFRRFEQHNGVDRERFPGFDADLRTAMFEEPIRFALDVVQRDGSVLDFIAGKHTFVNGPLARHYGMPEAPGGGDHWVRVEDADAYGRGGLLPMSVFLTANSPGLRTSPVKRGYWVVRRVLGERIPPPPANVPELPHDESKLGSLTLRQVLERHRADKACAGCHARFDSFGLVFEGYGPVGERRANDLGGKPVDTRATFPDGSDVTGLGGLVDYVRAHRQDDFLDNLSRKLLAYGLGRTLIPSDEAVVEDMRRNLGSRGNRWSALVDTIVTSRQFLTRRGASKVVAQQSPDAIAPRGIDP